MNCLHQWPLGHTVLSDPSTATAGAYHVRMDINLLVLNVGNTRLGIGVFIAGKLEYVTRVAHDNRSDWAGKIADAWSRIKDLEDPAIAGASVNPPLIEPLEHVVQQATGQA